MCCLSIGFLVIVGVGVRQGMEMRVVVGLGVFGVILVFVSISVFIRLIFVIKIYYLILFDSKLLAALSFMLTYFLYLYY